MSTGSGKLQLELTKLHCWYVCTQCIQIKLQVVNPSFRCVFTFNNREFCRKRCQKCCLLLVPLLEAQYKIPSQKDPVNVQKFQHKNRHDGNKNKGLIITFLPLHIFVCIFITRIINLVSSFYIQGVRKAQSV
jgi:hypothetical protein